MIFLPKYARSLTLALSLLVPLAVAEISHAAGRVFYDSFESGNTNLWLQDDVRPKCPVVTAPVNGSLGAYAGTRFLQCNMSSGGTYETLKLFTTYTDELFVRVRFRRDSDFVQGHDEGQKILRYFQLGSDGKDMFDITGKNQLANANAGNPNGIPDDFMPTYWGDGPDVGDHTNVPDAWHRVAYYIRQSTGTFKVWHDNVLIRDNTGMNYLGVKWTDFYITSNGDVTDSTNHTYYDEFEVFSDLGTGATGLMSDATISASGAGPTIPKAPALWLGMMVPSSW